MLVSRATFLALRSCSPTADVDFSAAAPVAVVELWRALSNWLFDPYRPELHYMRGPGPRWREKHAHADSKEAIFVPR
jgi:hypothetical protein